MQMQMLNQWRLSFVDYQLVDWTLNLNTFQLRTQNLFRRSNYTRSQQAIVTQNWNK